MRRIDGIYAQVKKTLKKSENKRWFFSVAFILAIIAFIFLFSPSTKVQSNDLPKEGLLDFSTAEILEIKGNGLRAVAVKVKKDENNELWLFDLENGKEVNISFEASVAADFPLGFKDNFIFWLSQDKSILFAYDVEKKIRTQKIIPNFSQNEQMEVKIERVPWEVIISGNDFSFFKPKTGKVFSDGNSEVIESFRQKFSLDSFLETDELANLGFSVEEVKEYE